MRVKGGGFSTMEVMEERNQGRGGTTSILLERPSQRQSCCDNGGESYNLNRIRNHDRCQNMIVQSQNQNPIRNQNHHHPPPPHHHHHQYHFGSSGIGRNIEIDWREVDPYFSELSDCASFWTLINFTCDVIYSGLFVLFFIMGQDVESMFFEGLLNHINPILIYLILSLVFNYGALRSLRGGRERCFLVFSIMKALLFPVTIMLLVYLVFFDVQEYFGTFWVSFVAIVSCYNGTAALGLWSMFTCNKYILVNEAAQKRMRKLAKQQRSTNYEADCRCGSSSAVPPPTAQAQASASYCEGNQIISSCSRTKPPNSASHSRKVGDSSCANNLILVCKPDVAASCTTTSCSKNSSMANNYHSANNQVFRGIGGGAGGGRCGPSKIPIAKDKRINNSFHGYGGGSSSTGRVGSSIVNIEDEEDDDYEDVLSFGDDDDDEVLQISTVHKVMQEIRFLDSKRDRPDTSDDDGDSL